MKNDCRIVMVYTQNRDCYNAAGEACKDYDKRGLYFLLIRVR